MKIIFATISDYQNIYNQLQIPLGILSLATVIEQDGRHKAEVVDFNYLYCNKIFEVVESLAENIDRDVEHLLTHKPDAISFYTMCNDYHIALLMALSIKKIAPQIKVLLGGPQATLVAEKTLKKYTCIDAIGLGEGENTILNILDGLTTGNLSEVKGIAYQRNGKVFVQPNDTLIENLDELPMIDLSIYKYKIENKMRLDVGRGCPYSCIFCSTKSFWKRKFRIKSAARIFNEIIYYNNTYGITSFNFEHDLFVANRKLVFELCKMIKDSKLSITWICSARVDTVDEELLKEMKSAGCNGIFFGIESGSERIQKYIRKNLNLEMVKKLPEILEKYSIESTYSFIYGFPEETEEDIEETLQLIYHLYDTYENAIKKGLLDVQLHKIIYLPETELTKDHASELIHPTDFSMEVAEGLESWGDDTLNEMIQDTDIFPNFCYIPSPLANKTQELHMFYDLFLFQNFSLFRVTYEGILKEMNGSFLRVYYAMNPYLNGQGVDYYNRFMKEPDFITERIIEAYSLFLKDYTFETIDKEVLEAIFSFEKDLYEILYRNRKYKKEIDITKVYPCDVMWMRKHKSFQVEKEPVEIRFYTENNRYIIKKKENTKNHKFMVPLLT